MTKRQQLVVDRAVRVGRWIPKHAAECGIPLRRSKPIQQLVTSMEHMLLYLRSRAALRGPWQRVLDCAVAHEARQIRNAVTKLDTLVSVTLAHDPGALAGWKAAKRLSPPPLGRRAHLSKAA